MSNLFSSVDVLLGSNPCGFVFMYDPKDPTHVVSVVAVRFGETIRILELVPSESSIRVFDVVEDGLVFYNNMLISFFDVYMETLCINPVLGSVAHRLDDPNGVA